MQQCKKCPSFIPGEHTHCPNCKSQHKKSRTKMAVSALGVSAISLTLMACYGGPPGDMEWRNPPPENQETKAPQKDEDEEKDK